jgi:hypothetical protein
VALAAEASAAVDARVEAVRDAAVDRRAMADALAEAVAATAAAAAAKEVLANNGCARCSAFELPPAEGAGIGPWVNMREVRAMIDLAASLKLFVVAPTVRIAVTVSGPSAGAQANESIASGSVQLRPLLPLAPLAGVMGALHSDVLPRYTAAFTLPCLQSRSPYESSQSFEPRSWLDGPEREDIERWLKRFTAALEHEVTTALTTSGGFVLTTITGARDKS